MYVNHTKCVHTRRSHDSRLWALPFALRRTIWLGPGWGLMAVVGGRATRVERREEQV